MVTLYPWQESGSARLAEILSSRDAALDASETGTGKTYTAAAVAQKLNRPTLVITPKAGLTMWRGVAEAFSVPLLGVRNPEGLRSRTDPIIRNKVWQVPAETLVIWDEVHRGASGRGSQTTELLAMLGVQHIKTLMLSATAADNPLKMRGIGYLLGLHQFNERSFYQWCRRYGCRAGFRGLVFPTGVRSQRYMGLIHKLIESQMVRVRRDEIPGFPECDTRAELYDIEEKYRNEICEIYAEMDAQLTKSTANPMVELIRARQRAELLKVPLLTDLAEEYLEDGLSVVLFVNFRETLERLHESLKQHGMSLIYGDQPDRDEQIRRFQHNETFVCGAMTQAGGVLVSLHDVFNQRARIALLTPSFSASDMVQCLGRIHRAGGTKALQRFILIAGTVEERVKRAIDRKLTCLSALNDGDLI